MIQGVLKGDEVPFYLKGWWAGIDKIGVGGRKTNVRKAQARIDTTKPSVLYSACGSVAQW
jgi:hypothetical protein